MTKSYHNDTMMTEKNKNPIITEDEILSISKKDIEQYILSLTEMDFSEILQNEHKDFEHDGKLFCDSDFVP